MSTITIIGHFLTFASMFWMILYFINVKNREFISHEIKLGTVCYRCKTKIKELDYWTIDKNDNKRELCVSCKRDDALKTVMNKKDKILSYLDKIDFTDNKWSRYFLYFSVSAVIFNFGNLFLSGLNIVGGLCLFLGQALFYHRYMSITRKKETQSN